MVAEGLDGTLGIQLDSCLDKGDLTADDLREIVIFLSHYAGWPKGAALNSMVETAIARHEKARALPPRADPAQASDRIALATRSVPNAVRIARYSRPVAAITAE